MSFSLVTKPVCGSMASSGFSKLGLPAGTSQKSPNLGWPWHRCSGAAGTQGDTLEQTHVQAETGVGGKQMANTGQSPPPGLSHWDCKFFLILLESDYSPQGCDEMNSAREPKTDAGGTREKRRSRIPPGQLRLCLDRSGLHPTCVPSQLVGDLRRHGHMGMAQPLLLGAPERLSKGGQAWALLKPAALRLACSYL